MQCTSLKSTRNFLWRPTYRNRMSVFLEANGWQENSWDKRSTSRVLQNVLEQYFRCSYCCIQLCMQNQYSLPITQRRGLIKHVPKKETDLKNLKNWRPSSLLNCDWKIATNSITNRIQATLPKLNNNYQTGFVKGRFIGENKCLIDSIVNYTANKNIHGLILLLEKAFHTLEWPFIEKNLTTLWLRPLDPKTLSVILKAA